MTTPRPPCFRYADGTRPDGPEHVPTVATCPRCEREYCEICYVGCPAFHPRKARTK